MCVLRQTQDSAKTSPTPQLKEPRQRDERPPLTIYARWQSHELLSPAEPHLGCKAHAYDVPIRPNEPLEVGRRVRVLALSRVAYHAPDVVCPRYETYDPHVVGDIVAGARIGESTATFELANECLLNPVKTVLLTVHWIPGVTGILPPADEEPGRTGNSRAVPLERDVVVAIPDRQALCGETNCAPARWPELGFRMEIRKFT